MILRFSVRKSLSPIFFIIPHFLYCQQWLGISTGNYSGTYGIYQNPANVVDSRYKAFINLAGGNLDFINNYAGWNAPYSFLGLVTNTASSKYRNPSGLIIYKNSYIKQSFDRQNSSIFLSAEAKAPALMYQFNKLKVGVGISSRARLLTSVTKLSPDIGRILVEGTNIPDFYGVEKTGGHFNFNTNAYTELAASIGFVLKEEDQDFIKVGITTKRINGLINQHILAENIDYKIERHPTRPVRQNILVNDAQGIFGSVSEDAIAGFGFSPDWLVGSLPPGIGYGADIGFVYEFRPDFDKYDMRIRGKWATDATKNKYKYRFGLALLDFGRVKFNKLDLARTGFVSRQNVMIPPGTFTKIENTDKLFIAFNSSFSVPESDYEKSFTVALPTAISMSFDYKFSEKIYFNTHWVQNLQNPNSKAMIQPSILAFVPRYETRWFEFSVPIALHNNYRNLALGIAGRVGGFFMGSDNIGGFFNIGNPRGISAYAGLFVPIFQKLPKNPNECYSENPIGIGGKIRNRNQKSKQKRRWNRLG